MEQFEPFQKVLVRDFDKEQWSCTFFSHIEKYRGDNKKYCCCGVVHEQCIPYEGNEHLLGTTDNPEPKHEYKFGDWIEHKFANGKWYRGIYVKYDYGYHCHIYVDEETKLFGNAFDIRPLAEDSDANTSTR